MSASMAGLMWGGREDLGLDCPGLWCQLPAHFVMAACNPSSLRLQLAIPHPALPCQCSLIPPIGRPCTWSSVSVGITCPMMSGSKPAGTGRNVPLRGLDCPHHHPGTGLWCLVSYLNQALSVHGHSSTQGGRGAQVET